jgi:hypothetical protein
MNIMKFFCATLTPALSSHAHVQSLKGAFLHARNEKNNMGMGWFIYFLLEHLAAHKI